MATVKDYLNENFVLDSTENEIEFYKTSVPGKGEVVVEYNTDDETCTIIHIDRSHRENFYEADNLRDLKETVEYCLGPLVSDKDWNQGSGKSRSGDHFDDEWSDDDLV